MRCLTPAVALAMVALSAQAALAGKSDFRVYNNTGTTLERLYITETGYRDWGRDILGRSVLPDGYSVGIHFANPSPRVCYYDIRAIFSGGETVEEYRVDVCNSDLYTIYRRPSRSVNYY